MMIKRSLWTLRIGFCCEALYGEEKKWFQGEVMEAAFVLEGQAEAEGQTGYH